MKAYGFMINGSGSRHGDDRKNSDGPHPRYSVVSRNALRTAKKAARRAGKAALNDVE